MFDDRLVPSGSGGGPDIGVSPFSLCRWSAESLRNGAVFPTTMPKTHRLVACAAAKLRRNTARIHTVPAVWKWRGGVVNRYRKLSDQIGQLFRRSWVRFLQPPL